jgi:hypothetical protein
MKDCVEKVELGSLITGQSLIELISNGGYRIVIFYKGETHKIDNIPLPNHIKDIFTPYQSFIRGQDGCTDFDNKWDWRFFSYYRTFMPYHKTDGTSYEEYLETHEKFWVFCKKIDY